MQIKRSARITAVAVAVLVSGGFRAAATAQEQAAPAGDSRLAGSWRLVSRVTTTPDGKVVADPGLAATPDGVLMYDRSGHVAVQLSRVGRTLEMLGDECRAAENVKGTSDTAQTILGYDAYFGTYTVDAKAKVVTHHLVGALFPGDIGKDIKRNFSLSGDTLRIRFNTTTAEGKAVTRTLIWKRM